MRYLQNTRRHAASSSTRRACESRATRRRSSATSRTRATVGMRARPHAKSARRLATERDVVVPRHRPRARPRHDAQGATATSICSSRNPRCSQRRLHPSTCLRLPKLKVHPDHHILVARALLGADDVSRRERVRVRLRFEDGANLSRDGADQNASATRASVRRATDPHDYPAGKSIYALRNVDALKKKAQERSAQRRRVRRAFARWSISMDADALCVRADLALRKIWRWRRRIGSIRLRSPRLTVSTPNASRACSSLFSVDRSHRAATTSCSSVCRSKRAHASSRKRCGLPHAKGDTMSTRDFSRVRLGASAACVSVA